MKPTKQEILERNRLLQAAERASRSNPAPKNYNLVMDAFNKRNQVKD